MLKIEDIDSKFSFSAIYKIINLINNKVYIGQSQNLYERFRDYKKGRFSPHLKKSIDKYNISNFAVEILEKNIPLEKLNEREQYYMNYYDSYNPKKGYNICSVAGTTRGLKKSIKEKEQMSLRMSEKTGNKNNFYGKTHSDETKQKISIINSNKKLSEEHINKFCKAGSNSLKKKIVQLSKNNNIIKIWDSLTEASEELSIALSSISFCLSKKRKTAGGFKWENASEFKPLGVLYQMRVVLEIKSNQAQ